MSGEQPPPGSNDQPWPSYAPDTGPPPPEERETLPPTHVPYGAPTPQVDTLSTALAKVRPKGLTRLLIALIPLVAVGAGGLFVFSNFSDDFSEITDTFTEGYDDPVGDDPAQPTADVHSVDGYADLLEAIAERTGSTMAFDASLYPGYASVVVPEDKTSQRSRRLSWNGELSDPQTLGTERTSERFDLADIDPEVMLRLLRRVQTMVEDPTSTYVLIRGASMAFSEGAQMSVYANNAYSEGAYIAADLSGKVIRRVKF